MQLAIQKANRKGREGDTTGKRPGRVTLSEATVSTNVRSEWDDGFGDGLTQTPRVGRNSELQKVAHHHAGGNGRLQREPRRGQAPFWDAQSHYGSYPFAVVARRIVSRPNI